MARGRMFSVVHQSIWGMPWGPGMNWFFDFGQGHCDLTKHIFGLYSTHNLINITAFYTNVWADDILHPKGNGLPKLLQPVFCVVREQQVEWCTDAYNRKAGNSSSLHVSCLSLEGTVCITMYKIQHTVCFIKLHYLTLHGLSEQIPNYGNESSNKPFPMTIVNKL